MKSAVIVASGLSSRYGSDKLKINILGKTVLERSVDAFRGIADEIIVVGECDIQGVKTVKGGSTRFQSVVNGLNAVSDNCDTVAVHDGARPFVSRRLVCELFDECERHGSAVPCLSVTDTVWQKCDGKLLKADRDTLLRVQTPQVFGYAKLKNAFDNAKYDYPDESSLFVDAYGDVRFVDGERGNIKITYPEDIADFRIGAGFDVHAFTSGYGGLLGGVKVPFTQKLAGHSDADVLCHALCDAVLSASGNKDIGWQFPDTDPKYKGANSMELLKQCVDKAKSNGYSVVNVSAVVICQQPKLAPYLDEMSASLAKVLQTDASCVNLSATTTERLGALGNGDGIACQAQALLRRI